MSPITIASSASGELPPRPDSRVRPRHRRRPRRSSPARWVAIALPAILALVASGCSSGLPPAPRGPASSPAPSAGTVPSPASPSPLPDVSTDPVVPAPSLPSFQPPAVTVRAPVAAGFVLHVPVLMYHRIVPPAQAGDSLPSLVVPPSLFADQMGSLAAAGWHTITAARLLTDLATGIRPAPKTFVITFDDGYDDGYTYALPILKAHGFVATFYVIAGRIGNAPGPLQALTPQHVQALARAGMEIGNHTFSHVDLASALPPMREYQIVAASARIQQLVGAAPTTLAYPFGGWDAAAAVDVQAAGIGIAFTTVEGAREAWATRYASPRVRVGPSTTPAMLLALVERFSL